MPRSTNARQRDDHTERNINGCYVCVTQIVGEQWHQELATGAANTLQRALLSRRAARVNAATSVKIQSLLFKTGGLQNLPFYLVKMYTNANAAAATTTTL